ncbi:MAG: SDR family oxidoreductase [Pseudolabrys sp.]|nr:SDR family oxidoreductase [Pseudolabrys sp.]
MTQDFGKVAIVTGGSRGIGAAIAQRLAADGFAVALSYAGNTKAAGDVVRAIETGGGKAIAVQGDVSAAATMRTVFAEATRAFGGVDVLVNTAGILTVAPIGEATDEAFDRIVAVNLKGTFNGLREAAQHLRNGGRIVNFSTSVVGTKLETYGLYTATKAAVEALTGILAKEMRGRTIAVNAVAPGPVATEMLLEGRSAEVLDVFAKLAPMERLGTPDDIAGVVSFLAGPDGGWVNGQVIRVNGGLV